MALFGISEGETDLDSPMLLRDLKKPKRESL